MDFFAPLSRRFPLPGLRWASANFSPATLWPGAEILGGVAVAAVLNGAVGVGFATSAVVSTRNAPRTSARVGAYRIAGLTEAPIPFELGPFSPAKASLASKISRLEKIRLAAEPFPRSAQFSAFSGAIPSQLLSSSGAAIVETRRCAPSYDNRPRGPGLASGRGSALADRRLLSPIWQEPVRI
jgi:hypothetical protein